MAAPRKFTVVGNFDKEISVYDVGRLANILRTGPLNPATEIVIGCPASLHSYAQEHMPRNVGIAAQNSFEDCVQSELASRFFPVLIPSYAFGWVLLQDLAQENKSTVAQRVIRAMEADLKVIASVCESADDHREGRTQAVIFKQLESLADAVSDWSRVVIAYDPASKGGLASTKQIQEALSLVRSWLRNNVSDEVGDATRIIYAGSVFSKNCHELAKLTDLDGFLVGGDALNFDFLQLANASRSSHTSLLMKHHQIKATAKLIHGLREEYFQFKSLQRKRCPKRYI